MQAIDLSSSRRGPQAMAELIDATPNDRLLLLVNSEGRQF